MRFVWLFPIRGIIGTNNKFTILQYDSAKNVLNNKEWDKN